MALFGLRLHVVVHHCGESKEECEAGDTTYMVKRRKEQIHACLLALSLFSPFLLCSGPPCLGNGAAYNGLGLSTMNNQDNQPDTVTVTV